MGAGYGGGSLVFAGVTYQPSEALFKRAFGAKVSYDRMAAKYYPRVRHVIGASPVPEKLLHRPEYAGARTWIGLGKRAGLPTKLLDLAIDWEIVAGELDGSRPRSVINGEFWYGNNSGAKLSLDRNYLARAEATGRLEVETQTEVVAIEEGPEHRYLVTANVLGDDGVVLATRRYAVKSLFLAAGANGTSEMLVRAKARGWLPRLNDEVGRHWGNNGDFFSAISGLHQRFAPNLGGTATVAIEDLENEVAPVVVECFADWQTEGENGLISSVGVGAPPPKGAFSYDAATDRVVLNWPADDPEIAKIARAAAATYQKVASGGEICHEVRQHAFGARVHHKSLQARGRRHGSETPGPVSDAVTAHGLGGVVLDEATDNIGTLAHYKRLYAIDGSLIPGHTGCTNPSLTIAALAERNIERILARDF
jgi:cholesterol oxidase